MKKARKAAQGQGKARQNQHLTFHSIPLCPVLSSPFHLTSLHFARLHQPEGIPICTPPRLLYSITYPFLHCRPTKHLSDIPEPVHSKTFLQYACKNCHNHLDGRHHNRCTERRGHHRSQSWRSRRGSHQHVHHRASLHLLHQSRPGCRLHPVPDAGLGRKPHRRDLHAIS